MADIAQQRSLTARTINTHLADLITCGEAIELDRLVKPEAQLEIKQAIAAIGHESLSQLRDYLKDKYTYDAIKLVRAQWIFESSQSTSDAVMQF